VLDILVALCIAFHIVVSAYRYIAIAHLPIIAVFVEYLRQFLIDLNQIYRHSSRVSNPGFTEPENPGYPGFIKPENPGFGCL